MYRTAQGTRPASHNKSKWRTTYTDAERLCHTPEANRILSITYTNAEMLCYMPEANRILSITYTNAERLCYTPEANRILSINCTSIENFSGAGKTAFPHAK